ncbi:MAG TPA: bifunctional (p)ppGpp synthetase/guanosine-3',5'-bis(diphosphate) 3'-pyrophosphohydrolase [Thermohalobaculum sp.]|nr:bifunctional (p)ppGpp synthetase/guanosine-3',5'-bis(diphosphate) 3'-pyrophosphohydrolase [Thermohalobaculum sp.]
MIRQFELVERVREYNPNTNEALLNRAYVFGARAHADQKRANGEPYFGHPLEVAAILTELKLDDASIITALLHDTIEDTPATREEISRLFGAEIADLVDGVTKLTQLELASSETAQAENFRKLLLAMAADVRVILVKLADRLHNMRTISHLAPDKRQRIAHETMDIYAPLAGRMGMQSIRTELEDMAFEVLNPEARTSIMRRFLKLRRDTGDMIPQISAEISAALSASGITAEVEGREKRPYSIWHKMEEKQTSFSQLSDIYGFRILCDNEDDCYRALGSVHRHWRSVPGRFKDYISGPKANGYRSIHTTVYGAGAMRVEIQIRTLTMHEVAETGVAAHWAYKDGQRVQNPFTVDPFKWLSDLVARMEKGDEPQEFLEHFKLDMFTDQVFCFTPEGDVIGLPRGATPIDFAYAIHTNVGSRCAGALIDGRRVPLWTRLRNGQQVEIITATGQTPSPHWEDMAQTGRAKSAIRRALRERMRDEQVGLGRDLAEQSFARADRSGGEKAFAAAAAKLGFASVAAMLVSLASGDVTGRQLVEAVYPSQPDAATLASDRADTAHPVKVAVRGIRRGAAIRFCTCCWPIPGDRIIGLSRRGGVVVHAISCPLLAEFEDDLEQWHDLTWDAQASKKPTNVARIALTIANQPGTLGTVCTLIGEQQANIDNLGVNLRKPDFFLMNVDLEVRDVKHLSNILTALRAQSFVNQVKRSITLPEHKADGTVEQQPRLPLGSNPVPHH